MQREEVQVSDDARLQELAQFVRSRRERCDPARIGIPVLGRRRTPGLRREEVATRAGVSITWYTWLEQARPIRASRQVLSSLADALVLDEVERTHLFRLASEVPPPGTTAGAWSRGLPAAYDLLLEHLEPNPAFVVDPRFDIWAWNRSCDVLYGDLSVLPAGRRNVLWLTFTSDLVKELWSDWERHALEAIALFRTQAGEGILAPELAGLVAELSTECPEFGRLWERRDVAPFVAGERSMTHPVLGPLRLQAAKLHVASEDKTLVVHLAEPGSDTAARLEAALAGRTQATVNPPSTGRMLPVT
jgi:transcriptional regulator with XRE-family HTH domain